MDQAILKDYEQTYLLFREASRHSQYGVAGSENFASISDRLRSDA